MARQLPPRYAAHLLLPADPFLPGSRQPRPAPWLPETGNPVWPAVALHRDPGFREGVDLYHLGFWWEAHERWEAPWSRAPRGDPVADLLRGLILLAASHLKQVLQQPAGAGQLLERSRTHLEQAAPAISGSVKGGSLDVTELSIRVREWSVRVPAVDWPTAPASRRTAILERMPWIWLPD